MSFFSLRKLAVSTVLILVLMSGAAPAVLGDDSSGGPTVAEKGLDAVVLRPLGAITLLFGGALVVPAATIGAAGGMESVDNVFDVFVRMPWENLVDAPLGRGFGLGG